MSFFAKTKPEKIAIVVDCSKDLKSVECRNEPSKFREKTKFDHVKNAVAIMVKSKAHISTKHQYSLFTLDETANLLVPFTESSEQIIETLQQLEAYSEHSSCNLDSIFEALGSTVDLADQEYLVRVIVVYGSKSAIPAVSEETTTGMLVDYVYLHDEFSQPNKEVILSELSKLKPSNKTNYSFSIGMDIHELYKAFSLLTAHPQQRISQEEIHNHFNQS